MTESYQQIRDRRRAAGERVELTLNTRVPEKYRVVDMETGNVWRWSPPGESIGRWRGASPRDVIEALESLGREP